MAEPSPEPNQTNQRFKSSPSSSAVPLTLYAATSAEFQPSGSRSLICVADFCEEQLQRGKGKLCVFWLLKITEL